ncbi:retrovirus-related pol polyprotein from transposon TNT 1-94 [Tanacetum coccineum]
MENLYEVRVKELRSDNRTEFRNHKLEEFYDEKGISQNFLSPYTLKQNGVAKKRNRTLIEAARTMLNSAKLPKQFWEEAVNTACYTQNRSIILKRHGKTAYDVFKGRSPDDIIYFYVFGYPVHIHNQRDLLGKFDEKADDEFFLGYSPMAKAFRVLTSEDKKWKKHIMLHLVKMMKQFLNPAQKEMQSTSMKINPSLMMNSLNQGIKLLNENVINEPIGVVQPSSTTISPSVESILHILVPQDRWSREKHIELVNIIGEPLAGITTKSRIRDSEAASAHECLVTISNQQEGIDYEENFAPVARLEAIKILLAYAAYMGFMVYQMDMKSAFLNGKISKEVYVQQPPGFESSEFPNHVCKLDKALYGLKQDPKACASVKCHMLPPNNLGPDKSEVSVNETLFRGMIGSLMYPTASRPDIQFSTCLYAMYKLTPRNPTLKSTLGGCQILGGKLVCWSAKKQSFVTMSSASVPIFGDNTSVIVISNNIDIRYHFIRDHILKGDIELHFVPTDLQLADIFTKPLAEPSFTRLVAELGMLNITGL